MEDKDLIRLINIIKSVDERYIKEKYLAFHKFTDEDVSYSIHLTDGDKFVVYFRCQESFSLAIFLKNKLGAKPEFYKVDLLLSLNGIKYTLTFRNNGQLFNDFKKCLDKLIKEPLENLIALKEILEKEDTLV